MIPRATPRVLLERQYRHAAADYLWELPAGRIDPGEQELQAAKRELLEETGYTAANWRRILKFFASPGFVAETMAVFLATGLRAGEAQPEEDEIIYKRMVPLPTAVRMVMSGTIRMPRRSLPCCGSITCRAPRSARSSCEELAATSHAVEKRSTCAVQRSRPLIFRTLFTPTAFA